MIKASKGEKMVFSSTIFLFVFLPIMLLIYYISKERYRNIILFVASVIFYACGEPRMIVLMLFSILCNYFFAMRIEKCSYKKRIFLLSITFNLGLLFLFKYLGFTIGAINLLFGSSLPMLKVALPIGISFYTFQAMSYVIDIYYKRVEAQHNILDLGLYISLFPQLIAGPIVRYSSIAEQIKTRDLSPELFGGVLNAL